MDNSLSLAVQGRVQQGTNSNIIPSGSYLIMSLGTTSIRKGIRSGEFVVDKTITATGFSGIENNDWMNITGTII